MEPFIKLYFISTERRISRYILLEVTKIVIFTFLMRLKSKVEEMKKEEKKRKKNKNVGEEEEEKHREKRWKVSLFI